jgi:hypothetical protein
MEINDAISEDSNVPFEEHITPGTKITVIKGGLLAWYLGNVGLDIYWLIQDPHDKIIILRLVSDAVGVLILIAPWWWLIGGRTAIVGFVFVASQYHLPDDAFLFAISAFDFVFVSCAQFALGSLQMLVQASLSI